MRSQGLSIRNSIATAHSNTARMRCRNRRAVSAFVCQMGARISSTSALVTSETGIFPMRGKGVPLEGQDPLAAVRPTSPAGLLLFYHTRGGFGEARYALPTTLLGKRVAALAGQLTVGQRLFRASARETSATLPSPSSRRRPRMTSR